MPKVILYKFKKNPVCNLLGLACKCCVLCTDYLILVSSLLIWN